MTVAGFIKAGIGRPAKPPRRLGLGLTLLALVACAPRHVTVMPGLLQDIAPVSARVDPHLFALTERWLSGGTAGDAPVGEWLHQVLVDDPRAPLRLTYVTSHLDVATVVSPRFDRPHASVARYRLTVRVEFPAISAGQAWLQGTGESRNWASAARAVSDAITQAVREIYRQLAALREAVGPREEAPRSVSDDTTGQG
jgi:hypothetical protein